uniref:FAM192A/Fyv6 N-terminal domain-containing protein n=1 Tax=Clastoptera arizonana TaxID=38151 RepID=A0A1B6CR71_9HEMI
MSSGFISEKEIAEKKKKRQEEWEKVRKPDMPLEAPEEEFDNRSLFERLQLEKHRKEKEQEETHRLKNMVRGLDDEEVEFLDQVDRTKLAAERRNLDDESKALKEFREFRSNQTLKVTDAIMDLVDNSATKKTTVTKTAQPSSTKRTQYQLLAGGVKRRLPKNDLKEVAKRPK